MLPAMELTRRDFLNGLAWAAGAPAALAQSGLQGQTDDTAMHA